ncbi:MAG: hypothetical protein A2W99_05135 [Bacteroidetes bacterium GWF2_33_16]|nr:MAG: hypothetical protein A2X00_17655 [Bacteroidetes bacterium GWE2_32_14]OFY06050.1 MAG: hypothetical protein A2W99_05135 [Bacteroidetes bacterium GWF2_33_16]
MSTILSGQFFATNLELFLIIILLVYILYLQLRLAKKNHILESYISRLQKKEEEWSKSESSDYIDNFNKKSLKDKFLNDDIYEFLFGDKEDVKIYLHYTRTKAVANEILDGGFKFVNSFYKTAELVFNDKLYLIHRHNEHKQFGEYVIVISISKKIFNHYTQELSKIKAKNIAVEQVLTEVPHYTDDNSEEVYTCPRQFIKGYFNYLDGTIIRNSDFNSNYTSKKFEENLKNLVSQV